MYSKETAEEFLSAREVGMTLLPTSSFAGITFWAARCWSRGRLPHSYTGARCAPRRRMDGPKPTRGKARHMPDKKLYDQPRSGPLAGLSPDQIENLLLRAVLADLKSGRVGPGFDLEQEQMRARREIEAGDRPAPPLDHRFLEDIEELL